MPYKPCNVEMLTFKAPRSVCNVDLMQQFDTLTNVPTPALRQGRPIIPTLLTLRFIPAVLSALFQMQAVMRI